MEYKASLDSFAKVVTIFVIILFLWLGIISIKGLINPIDTTSIIIHSALLLLYISTLLGTWLYAPKKYIIDENRLIIVRAIGNLVIHRKDIKQVIILNEKESRQSFRTFGVGGLFGYFGKFYLRNYGYVNFYTTQHKNKILILTQNDQKLVLTPDDSSMAHQLM